MKKIASLIFRMISICSKFYTAHCFDFFLNESPVTDMLIVYIWSAAAPLRKVNFLRNPGVTKESAKQRRRPLNSNPAVLMFTE